VTPDSRLHGVEVAELRLPPGASVAMVVRDGAGFVPDATTSVRHGDDLLVVAPHGTRRDVQARLQAISRRGRLAAWKGTDEGAPETIPLRWSLPRRGQRVD
jgi:cell volume regulation protein A